VSYGHPAPAASEAMYSGIIETLRRSALNAAEIGALTGVSERQVQRWGSGTSKPDGDNRTKLLEISYVVDQLLEVYTAEGVEIWLHGRNRGLGGRRPLELLREQKFDMVLQAIERLNAGTM